MKSAHEPGHLLIVDDNKVNRILLARGLEQQGHTTETAENGRQGLEMIKHGNYDLVLLDIEMPEMNGFQVLEACLKDVDLRNIPIIMTSSLDELDSVVKCIELGAEDYLHKPVNPILLRARVNASLEKKRLRDEQRKLFRTFATKEVAEELLTERDDDPDIRVDGEGLRGYIFMIKKVINLICDNPEIALLSQLNHLFAAFLRQGHPGGILKRRDKIKKLWLKSGKHFFQ